jgi:hypothetical protein
LEAGAAAPKFCVARASFIDRDSREALEIRTHKRLIDVLDPNPKTIDTLMRLDLPAGVDIEIRRSMWQFLRDLNAAGTSIILTTHYIEEAEEMADRIGVINKGELILVEDKDVLMRKLGKKQLTIQLREPLAALPAGLADDALSLSADGLELTWSFDAQAEETGIADSSNRERINFTRNNSASWEVVTPNIVAGDIVQVVDPWGFIEQMTVAAPMVSQACIWRTRLFEAVIFRIEYARLSVTLIARPSGTATTIIVTAIIK